jgi:protein involved in polysaccharide export with SLBB domain
MNQLTRTLFTALLLVAALPAQAQTTRLTPAMANALSGAAAPLSTASPQTPIESTGLPRGGEIHGATGLGAPIPADELAGPPQATPRPDEPNDFQRFVQMATGEQIPRFGQNLFNGAPSTYAPVSNIPVTPDYLIGPGDELLIRAWGGIDVETRAAVDRNGQIYLPKVGAINVSGIRAAEIESFLKTRIGRLFRNFDLNVTLGQLRSMQIYVVGHARRPGTYTLSSLSTLVNALFASGGPGPTGSMRDVQLKRGGSVIARLDLYDFITRGDKQADIRLMPGDILVLPPVGPQVAVLGPQRLQAIYELKSPGESIQNVVAQGGGLSVLTAKQLALLERVDPKRIPARSTQTIELDEKGMNTPLQDGDILTLMPVSPEIGNAVTLRGNVAAPIRYPFVAGMRVKDLIPNREALIPVDYHLRKNQMVQFNNAGQNVSQGKLVTNIKNLLDEVNWEYAAIERLDASQLTSTLIPFNLAKAVLDRDPAHNLELRSGDVVTIFSKNDIRVPQAKRNRLIRIEGEVASPGVYQVQPGETLRQLVARVGGATPQAYLYAAEFYRESTRKHQQEKLDIVLDRMEKSMTLASGTAVQSALSAEDLAAKQAQQQFNSQVVARMRTVKASGRMVLEVPPGSNAVAMLPDIPLEDGDRLVVPAVPSNVSVVGEVHNENAFIFKPGKTLDDYLQQAGGPTRDGDEGALYVLKADGSVVASNGNWFGTWFKTAQIMPGDTIVVPILAERKSWSKDIKDWTQILYQFGMGAAAIQVLK